MNIVLLSGGSGKRLWPLSNDVRSKQFLKLFQHENSYESMVQRVYRQIHAVNEDIGITIATSKTQVSSIHNQLGDKVSICVEPARRDTFPAIVLAASYLYDELHVSREEVMIVCPVDPYVEDDFFESVMKLEKTVQQGKTRLTLMGIEPTYPSEKYGYIIPESQDKIAKVKEFKEKPDRETAKRYIQKGALWNAGVFAFKLGYILDIAHDTVAFQDYRDLYRKYYLLEKISFDYAVVEKEASIQVVRYAGEWKDVGTWNTMTEVMADTTKGDVTLDDTVENTQVINELDIPILVMGAKNMVVAASGDGILIADKERSGYMKSYVEAISTEVRYAEKSWGDYRVIDAGQNSLTAKIVLEKGRRLSYHRHENRNEVWTILAGKGKVVVDSIQQEVQCGDVITINAGCKHTIMAESQMTILETQIGEEISAQDKTKFELNEMLDSCEQ